MSAGDAMNIVRLGFFPQSLGDALCAQVQQPQPGLADQLGIRWIGGSVAAVHHHVFAFQYGCVQKRKPPRSTVAAVLKKIR
jgi:hypothetical protein